MGPNELSAALAAAQPLLEKLVALGVPGIICIILALPMLAIVAAFVSAFILNARHAKRMETSRTPRDAWIETTAAGKSSDDVESRPPRDAGLKQFFGAFGWLPRDGRFGR